MAQDQQVKTILFKSIQLFKEQTLGIGSYGKVCKAKCGNLICAAKLMHETLFDPMAQLQISPQKEHRLPMRRFEQECEFLSTVRHPNIILYLGMHRDEDTGLPVLLMELMDDNLTHFLESSPQPIPYHIAVNICHDITLALSFLHSNDIVHRDLSSNNVLLRGNILAKVTDFGMARLGDINPHGTRFTSTTCPGTDVYMPPEAVKDKPVYSEKMDCFSFGVVTLQILTRLFPKPGDRMQEVEFQHPGLPPGTVMVRTPEINRRQDHIDKVDPNHPLLPVVLDCLQDNDIQRPSADQLCERTAALKETAECRDTCDRMTDRQLEITAEQLQQKELCIASRDQQLSECREEIQRLSQDNEHLHQDILRLERDNQRLERDKNIQLQEKESQLNRVNYLLEESERSVADFATRAFELEGQLNHQDQPQTQGHDDRSRADSGAVIKLRWREGETAPCAICRFGDAVVGGDVVYCRERASSGEDKIYAYHTTTSKWFRIPSCPVYKGFAIAIVNEKLTTVGGFGKDSKDTNKLFSLTGTGVDNWSEEFPPMSTKRWQVSALCTGTALIVIGGQKGYERLKTVEILNTLTRQWHIVTELPEPSSASSMTVCGDRVYLLGGYDKGGVRTRSVYSCSLTALLLSGRSGLVRALSRSSSYDIWTRVADLPVSQSTAVSLRDQLIAVGGRDSTDQPTSAIHRYDSSTNSWEVISHMATARSKCLAVVLPDNKLMVVGGKINDYALTASVEFSKV